MNKTYRCANCYKGQCMKLKTPCNNDMCECKRRSTAREIALNFLNYHHNKDCEFYSNSIDYPLGNGFTLSIGDTYPDRKIRIALYDLDEPVDLCWGARINMGSIYTDSDGLLDNILEVLQDKKELLNYHR